MYVRVKCLFIDSDECASNPCKNGATCVDHFGRFECVCNVGDSGALCELGKKIPNI